MCIYRAGMRESGEGGREARLEATRLRAANHSNDNSNSDTHNNTNTNTKHNNNNISNTSNDIANHINTSNTSNTSNAWVASKPPMVTRFAHPGARISRTTISHDAHAVRALDPAHCMGARDRLTKSLSSICRHIATQL